MKGAAGFSAPVESDGASSRSARKGRDENRERGGIDSGKGGQSVGGLGLITFVQQKIPPLIVCASVLTLT